MLLVQGQRQQSPVVKDNSYDAPGGLLIGLASDGRTPKQVLRQNGQIGTGVVVHLQAVAQRSLDRKSVV